MAKNDAKLVQENENLKKIIVALDEKSKKQVEELEAQVSSIKEELANAHKDVNNVVNGENTSTTESTIVDKYMEELGLK